MSSTIEKLNCPKCSELVNDNEDSICCDLCDSWFHLKCSLLDRTKFQFLVENSSESWFCKFCIKKSLPFQSLTDNKLKNTIAFITEENENLFASLTNPETGMQRKCNVCDKKVCDVSKSAPSVDCNSLIHIRCSDLQLWNLTNVSKLLKELCCKTCWHDRFPFNELEKPEIIELTFNSNFSCRCQTVNTESCDYQQLERLNLCKLDLTQLTSFIS